MEWEEQGLFVNKILVLGSNGYRSECRENKKSNQEWHIIENENITLSHIICVVLSKREKKIFLSSNAVLWFLSAKWILFWWNKAIQAECRQYAG